MDPSKVIFPSGFDLKKDGRRYDYWSAYKSQIFLNTDFPSSYISSYVLYINKILAFKNSIIAWFTSGVNLFTSSYWS